MTRFPAIAVMLLTTALLGCSSPGHDLWFDGDLGEALEAAADRDTLVFIEFETDWCGWCRRFETETLADAAVRAELAGFVALQLNAEKEGADAAARLEIESYPTVVFLNEEGDEVERIVGYLPPKKFLQEVHRIRKGDTLVACFEQLAADPTNVAAIRRAVQGLLERSDPEGAIAKIKAFHSAEHHDHEVCRELMFLAGRDLHYRVYLKGAKLYRLGWKATLEVPPVPGSLRLNALLADGLTERAPEEQATLMREARYADAADLLEIVNRDTASGDELFTIASFAFRGGHYGIAGELYERWFDDDTAEHDADSLNRAAWQLYLARESIETAVAMAREAYANDPSSDIADTLARALYVNGDTDEAIGFEIAATNGADGDQAGAFAKTVEVMKAGGDLGDEPAFESYPGPREIAL